MENNVQNQQNQFQEEEINIMPIVKRLWEKKTLIIKVTCVFAVLGVIVALSSPKVYTSSCTFIPQTSKKSGGGGLASLAALAGISLGDMESGESLSPMVYPQILNNIDFRKDLMYSKIKFQDYEEPIALIDYYTNPKYAKFNLFSVVKKYTIGLPFMILNAIRGEQAPLDMNGAGVSIRSYNKDEYKCSEILGKCVSMQLEEKKGYIHITANMAEPIAAAQLCQRVFDLLQKYVTEFKIMKVQNKLNFINSRFEETKIQYEQKQKALASFMDANKVISTAQAQIEQEKLASEYNMANAIYTEMAKQRLQAEIQVKEDTPILSAVKPVVVPYEKSKPRRAKILFIWTLFGGVFGCALVVGIDWFIEQGVENIWLKKLIEDKKEIA